MLSQHVKVLKYFIYIISLRKVIAFFSAPCVKNVQRNQFHKIDFISFTNRFQKPKLKLENAWEGVFDGSGEVQKCVQPSAVLGMTFTGKKSF